MLFTKWILAEAAHFQALKNTTAVAGWCLNFTYTPGCMQSLYSFAQEIKGYNNFTILLSQKSFEASQADWGNISDAIITLFFQPSFYINNNTPLIFMDAVGNEHIEKLAGQLKKKCLLQGFNDLTVICPYSITDQPVFSKQAFACYVDNSSFNLDIIVENWLKRYLEEGDCSPLHFIVPSDDTANPQLYENFEYHESLIRQKHIFKVATSLFNMQTETHQLGQQLQEQKINEDNLQLYLDIQRKDLAKALNWYHYEYEILPLWYKQFGHLIKVIMGKRSFRSLYNDNVKKYKD